MNNQDLQLEIESLEAQLDDRDSEIAILKAELAKSKYMLGETMAFIKQSNR